MDDYDLDLAVAAVETGTLNRSVSLLIQAGFNSRLAAIKVVADTGADFQSGRELRRWLRSDLVSYWSEFADWPTPETHAMWVDFAKEINPEEDQTWMLRKYTSIVNWKAPVPQPGTPLHFHQMNGVNYILAEDGFPLGSIAAAINTERKGLLRVKVGDKLNVELDYIGPNDIRAR